MYIVVDSLTGQSLSFAKNLEYEVFRLGVDEIPKEGEFFLVTRSHGFGEIPPNTKKFLDDRHKNCIGLAVSGNKNWGRNYGAAGDKIEKEYNIPLILKFEATGFPKDREIVKNYLRSKVNGI